MPWGKTHFSRRAYQLPRGAFLPRVYYGLGGFGWTLNGTVFLYFLEPFLCPQLKPGQVVIMDNAPAHQVEWIVGLIEPTGARLLYLPPYSLDLITPLKWLGQKLNSFSEKSKHVPKRSYIRPWFKLSTSSPWIRLKLILNRSEYASNIAGRCYISPRYQFSKRSTS